MEKQERSVTLRKYENRLRISGIAVIAFSIWTIIKSVFWFLLTPLNMSAFIGDDYKAVIPEDLEWIVEPVFFVILFGAMLIGLAFRYYIGRSAVKESKGTKKSCVYLILAGLLALFLLMGPVLQVLMIARQDPSAAESSTVSDRTFMSGLIDLTSLVALVEMMISSIRVRRIRRKRITGGR